MIYIFILIVFYFIYNFTLPIGRNLNSYTILFYLVFLYLIYKNIIFSLILILIFFIFYKKNNNTKNNTLKNKNKLDRCFEISKYDIKYKRTSPVNKAFEIKINKI